MVAMQLMEPLQRTRTTLDGRQQRMLACIPTYASVLQLVSV